MKSENLRRYPDKSKSVDDYDKPSKKKVALRKRRHMLEDKRRENIKWDALDVLS